MADKPMVDFDHKSAEFAADPWGFYQGMRKSCPMAWTDYYGGYWLTSPRLTVVDVSRDDATFSSRKGVFDGVQLTGIGLPPSPQMLLPIELDPPELRTYRMAMNPAFSPAVVESLEPMFLAFTTW